MAKPSSLPARRPAGPINNTHRPMAPTLPDTRSHEGAPAFSLDVRSELFLLAVTNMVGEATFYESADARDGRFRRLIAQATTEDPAWTAAFLGWLRGPGLMRSASIVGACEYIKAGGPHGRAVLDSVCQRPDEPGEALGYWLNTYGRALPMPVKRGLADAARRLYGERAVLKYDTPRHPVRFADVLELAHPRPSAMWQRQLFGHIIDRRHGRPVELGALRAAGLDVLHSTYTLDAIEPGRRRGILRGEEDDALTQAVADAGLTWERLSGWLPGGMDAEAWSLIVPRMGYMALLRNLRNLEQAKVSPDVLDAVARRLADPEQVARSKQFPFRFWTAYRELDAAGYTRFLHPLEQAAELACANIPELTGRTLVMVDTSGSMEAPISGRSSVPRVEVGGFFGAALAHRGDVVLWQYATHAAPVKVMGSIVATARELRRLMGSVGHGTNTWPSVAQALATVGKVDRVIVLSDVQDHPQGRGDMWSHRPAASAPEGVRVYAWNLAGYASVNLDTAQAGHYMLGGFSDAAFRIMGLLERGQDAGWPWEITGS